MGLIHYFCAVAWAINASYHGSKTTEGLICYLIASVFFVGGTIVFAIKDATPPAIDGMEKTR